MLGKWCGHEVAALRSWSYGNGWDRPERAWRGGLFSTGTAGIWGRMFFAVGAYLVPWKVFSTNPGLYSLGASRAPSIVARQMSLDIAKRLWIRVGSNKTFIFWELLVQSNERAREKGISVCVKWSEGKFLSQKKMKRNGQRSRRKMSRYWCHRTKGR